MDTELQDTDTETLGKNENHNKLKITEKSL